MDASETFRALVARIDSSDVIAYLARQPSEVTGVAAHVSFVLAAGGRRYVRVAIDPKYGGCQLLALLGHELQHVAEIADEPSVVSERSLATFYRRVGYSIDDPESERFESRPAVDAGRRIMHEVLAFTAAAASPAPRPRR